MRQGEIITGLVTYKIEREEKNKDEFTVQPILHPYVIVVSQDCDLTQDFRSRESSDKSASGEDKLIPSILFCEVVEAEILYKKPKEIMNSKIWNNVKNNKNERYHFFEKISPERDALEKSLPELGVDFKRYFTVATEEVYKQISSTAQKRSRLLSPYLEHFVQDFVITSIE